MTDEAKTVVVRIQFCSVCSRDTMCRAIGITCKRCFLTRAPGDKQPRLRLVTESPLVYAADGHEEASS